ncbi:MAG: FHA domain-containing protein, partial [Planctomycetota bacterium]
MPAKITVQSGIAAGASHWIQQRVVRIGSDPTAEVCLPSANVPGHALTLEYKDGNYRVYNRCRDNVYVGTRVVEPNRVATW